MDVYVYSDESGVFDSVHNDYFVFGGIIFFDKKNKDIMERKFIHAENCIRSSLNLEKNEELKACKLSNKIKGKLYRSLNKCLKFCVIIDQKKILDSIFKQKKSKQRYLDYAYKIGLKRCFEYLITSNNISASNINNINVYVDEHTTATNGCYELQEGLLNEFKYGTYNLEWSKFFPPIFPKMNNLNVTFCDFKSKTLIRAADIIANKIYFLKTHNMQINTKGNLIITQLP